MHRSLIEFVRDDAGYVLSAELVLVATISVLSLVVGLSNISAAVNSELSDVATAFGRLNQTYHAQTPCSPAGSGCQSQHDNSSDQDSGTSDFANDA